MKALVLAGGKGTRLRPLTYAMAKQLVPVANKPILHYALDSLYQAGIRDFGIVISPETGDSIRQSVATWQPSDAGVQFIVQDEPAGLAHAVKISADYLQAEPFMMYLGDNLIQADLAQWIHTFHAAGCDASILLKPVSNPSAFGVAELDGDGHVLRLVEKPKQPASDLALVGVYLFTPRIFEAIHRIQPSKRGELEITDAIQRLIDEQAVVHARIHDAWWLDTGKKDDLLAANQVVLQDFIKPALHGQVDQASQVIGAISVGSDTVVTRSVLQGPSIIGRRCVIENATIGPLTAIGDDCVIRNCHVENSVILEGCQLDSVSGRVEKSVVGKGCRIIKASETESGYQFLLANQSDIQIP